MLDSRPETRAETPRGIGHLVLCVRDLADSHAFWTRALGFAHVATTYRPDAAGTPQPTNYYSGRRDGELSHHDVALSEDSRLRSGDAGLAGVDHIAIEYASEAAWRRQIEFLTDRGIEVGSRIRRGTVLSARVTEPTGYVIELICDLPRELWESDIDAAINRRPIRLS